VKHAPDADVERGTEIQRRIVEPLKDTEIARRLWFRPSPEAVGAVRRFVQLRVESELLVLSWERTPPA